VIWIDYAIIGLLGISAAIGFFRGFVTEAFSLTAWVVAFWVGLNFSRELSVYFEATVPMPSVRIALSFALLFLLTLVVGSLLRMILRQLVTSTGLTGSDRFLGLVFGIARGVLVVSILVFLAGLTPFPEDPWWDESSLLEWFQPLVLWLREYIPSVIAGNINYQ